MKIHSSTKELVRPRVLIVDDHPANIELIRKTIESKEFAIATAETAAAAREQFQNFKPHLVLLDLFLPDGNGLELLSEMHRADPLADVILVTAHYSTESAVEAIQKGAWDYITKPLNLAAFLARLDRWLEIYRQHARATALESELLEVSAFEGIIGRSPLMLDMLSKLRRIGPHYETALVTGETGTGKEMVARALHALSGRRGALVICNCATITESLFESELFGHERGAFTGAVQSRRGLVESAEGGTLFLDEVGEIPLTAQPKLLRLLQNREIQRVGSSRPTRVDVRVVAATHRDLAQMVAERQFREDLYFRLSAVQVALPPLSARMEDLPLLTGHFLRVLEERVGKPGLALTRRAQAILAQYRWPGNIRELENALRYAAMMAEGVTIDMEDLPTTLHSAATVEPTSPQGGLLKLHEVVYQHAQHALDHCNGNRAQAAQMIGIGRATLYRLLAKHSQPTNRKQKPSAVTA